MPKNSRTKQLPPARKPGTSPAASVIKLHLLPDAPDQDGLPRVALELPPPAGQGNRRPTFRVFGSLAAALATKQALEGGR